MESKKYDLEERCLKFARNARSFIIQLPQTAGNYEDSKQLIRSSASIGANYIEANEACSKKDFLCRIKISRKEAKESIYWLELVATRSRADLEQGRLQLVQEAGELVKIFSAIAQKCQGA